MKANGVTEGGMAETGTVPGVHGTGISGTLIGMIIDYGVREAGGKCGMKAGSAGGG